MAQVSFRNVRKSFGKVEVIHGVDAEIGSGEFVVVVGPSGCGKSTLLRLIAGLEALSAGEIAIADRVVNDLEPKDRDVAMVFQNYALYPHMTAFENIGYALRIARRPKAEIRKRVTNVAKILEIGDLLDRKPSQLSGGQRQRVAMGRAIVREPAVFLFDEPLSNLDAKLRVQMRVEIRRLHNQLGATSIFVTHDQVEAMTMANRLIVMNEGRIEQVGSPKAVYDRPATTFVGSFIGSPPMNFIAGVVDGQGGRVRTPSGASLPLGEAVPALDGRAVTIGIRPEHLSYGVPEGEAMLTAHLDFVEELGASRLLHLRADSEGLIVQVAAEDPLPGNGVIRLGVEARHVHLFDAQSGRRLGSGIEA